MMMDDFVFLDAVLGNKILLHFVSNYYLNLFKRDNIVARPLFNTSIVLHGVLSICFIILRYDDG